MRLTEKVIHFAQILAAIVLGTAYFLPLYETYGILGGVKYAKGEAWLFFWAIPAATAIYFISHRWLRLAACILSSLGGVMALGLLYFLANFKATPLGGFFLAQMSIFVLILCWLAIGVIEIRRKTRNQIAPG